MRRILLGAAIAALALLAGPRSAAADNEIVESNPAQGAQVTTQPTSIVMTFENEITGAQLVSIACDGNPFAGHGDPQLGDDDVTLTVPLTGSLPEGQCNVVWTLNNAEEQVDATGTLSFRVAAGAAAAAPDQQQAAATEPANPAPTAAASDNDIRNASSVSSGPVWLGRVLSVVGISVLFGSLVLIVAAWPEGPEYVLALRFLRSVWVIAVVGTLIYVAALAGAVKGEGFGSGFNPSSWFDLFDAGWAGRAAVMRVVFVLACGWVVVKPERVIDPTTNMPALGIPALAVLTLGLSRPGGDFAYIGVFASIVHVLAVAIWFGAAVLLARVVLAGPGEEDLVHAVRGFVRISNPAIVLAVATGLIQLWRQVGGELFSSGHGRVLLLKTLAVGAMLFVGMTARQIVNARLSRASELSVNIADRMRRAFGTEAAIGLIVIALTGWMLNLTPGKDDDGVGDVEVREPITDPALGLDIEVLLDPGRVGPNDLTVIVRGPETGIAGLRLTFHPPANTSASLLSQDIALTAPGVARTAEGFGLPFPVAGTWRLQVEGNTADGTSFDIGEPFTILNEDGSAPDPGDVSVPPIAQTTATTPPATPAATTETTDG